LQTERIQYQRQYSDDEGQYDVMYDQDTPLMETELARQPTAVPRAQSKAKVTSSIDIL